MNEKPILFSAPMVVAIRNGTKTQTRRIAKPQPVSSNRFDGGAYLPQPKRTFSAGQINGEISVDAPYIYLCCPYGKPGDRLWVRETWMPDAPRDGTWPDTAFFGCKGAPLSMIPERFRSPAHCLYRATWEGDVLVGWRPSIHIPRWASRITLDLTGVRVERLKDISEADCIAEGVQRYSGPLRWVRYLDAITGEPIHNSARDAYFALWEALNGAGSVDANPWLWVLEFSQYKTPLSQQVARAQAEIATWSPERRAACQLEGST